MNLSKKALYLAAGIATCWGLTGAARAQVVISQVYGGGGNSGATYNQDFVELFNPGTAPVTMTNWSVQYETQAGTSWTVLATINATLMPGHYFLIGGATGATGATLPTLDAMGATNLNSTQGKILLTDSATAVATQCPTTGIIDLVGYGTTATVCREGTANAPAAANNASAVLRINLGCTDMNQNGADFVSGPVNPRNTSSPATDCASTVMGPCCAPIGDCTMTTQTGCASGSAWSATGSCTPTNPCVASVGACCSASGFCSLTTPGTCTGGSQFQTLGSTCIPTNPCIALIAACCNNSDGLCTTNFPTACPAGTTAQAAGTSCSPNLCTQPMGACCSDNSATATCTLQPANLCAPLSNFLGGGTVCTPSPCGGPGVVISQLYGGGGSTAAAATYQQDYVELFNRTSTAIDVSGWTIQHASSTGTTWDKTTAIPAGTSIQPGRYFLVVLTQSGGPFAGADLTPQSNFTPANSVAFAAGSGKAALVRTATLIASGTACPATAGAVADFVGYGGADCFEGTAGVAALSTNTAALRAMNGCQDTNDNAADFTAGTPAPRNASTAANFCGTPPSGTCCDPATGGCTFVTLANCAAGSTWTANGSCTPNPCAQPATGVCCRGATCNASVTQANCTAPTAHAGAVFVSAAATCNATGNRTTPCCEANYNKVGGITVQDIFDFLADWFGGSAFSRVGGDGTGAPPGVQSIFDFLAAWFAGGCS